MLTLRASAALLRAATTVDHLLAIGKAAGFSAEVLLDAETRADLGLDDSLAHPTLLRGNGSLRALAFVADGDARALLSRTANRLTARAPHILWLLLAVERGSNRVLIGAPTPGPRGARVAALIVDRGRVMDSDADTLRLLGASASDDDLATHGRFVEILGRDALSRAFFRKLDECVGVLAAAATTGSRESRREIALLYSSRLLFLAFLESRGWLDGDGAFLANAFDRCMAAGGGFHARVLLPLFFGTLNTPVRRRASRARQFGSIPFLNGGLFTPTAAERESRSLRFTDEACGHFIGELLSRYRFTAIEETASFEEAAVDPEMLGRAFECLMAPDTRRVSGAFYTPHELVERVTACGLETALRTTPLEELRILDPACGSGAFLVHALDRVTSLRADAGDTRPTDAIRRDVLSRSIFGVDCNPTAVWLCQLRLWLSIVVECRAESPGQVPPLPNLDRNVRVGDSLAGPAFGAAALPGSAALRRLRERYARSTGVRKASLSRVLDREERRLVIASTEQELARVSAARRELVTARRGRDLFGGRYQPSRDEIVEAASLRATSTELRARMRAAQRGGALPFSFPAHFADVAARGGFSLVVGNPPWVRPHNIDVSTRNSLRRSFTVARSAPWAAGAGAAGAGNGFASQVDLAAIFVERSLRLLEPHGALSLLLPSKLWRSLAGGGMRRLIQSDSRLIRVEDYADVPAAFDAAVYPGLCVAARDRSSPDPVTISVLHRARVPATWTTELSDLSWDDTPGAPWLLIPPEVRRSFEAIRKRGTPMHESRFGRPLLGVKCGLNEAFVVRIRSHANGHAAIIAGNGRDGLIETEVLRPLLRGEQVRAWSPADCDERIIWTHGPSAPLSKLPDGAARWLGPYRRALSARADARRTSRWWSVFRTEGAAADKARVVWADIGRSVRATVLAANDPTVPLNSCYVARCPSHADAMALAALLNSPLVTAWLAVIAEPARGGYRRYLGWTMSLLPIPAKWDECRDILATVGERAMRDPRSVDADELLELAMAAYRLKRREVEPLLTWTAP